MPSTNRPASASKLTKLKERANFAADKAQFAYKEWKQLRERYAAYAEYPLHPAANKEPECLGCLSDALKLKRDMAAAEKLARKWAKKERELHALWDKMEAYIWPGKLFVLQN